MEPKEREQSTGNSSTLLQKALAYVVHFYTASGVIWAILATMAITQNNRKLAYFWLLIAVIVDSSDGFLARKWEVKKHVPYIDGATLDNIADYLNYTFIPLFIIWKEGWLPEPGWLWISFPLVASLFAFSHTGAKESDAGFFRGFPSYWNFFTLYTDICFFPIGGRYLTLGIMLFLSFLNVTPLRFVYPSRAKRWQAFFIYGAIAWTFYFLYMLYLHPDVPPLIAWTSLIYPVLYLVLSVYLDFDARKKEKVSHQSSQS